MFWKKEKILKLKIGKVSESTIKENFPMIEREYENLLEPMRNKVNSFNNNILIVIHEEIKRYVCYINKTNRVSEEEESRFSFTSHTRPILSKKGEYEVNKLIKNLKLPKILIDEDILMKEVDEIEDELKYLRNKFKKDEDY